MIDYKAVVEHKSKYEVNGVTLKSLDPIMEYTLAIKTDNIQLFNQIIKIVVEAAWKEDEAKMESEL